MTRPARRWTGDALMLVTALLMGSSYPVAKDVLAVMSPLLYSSSRYAIAIGSIEGRDRIATG